MASFSLSSSSSSPRAAAGARASASAVVLLSVAVLAAVLSAGPAQAAYAPDLVSSLPGVPKMPTFPLYSGFLNVTGTAKRLHYVLVTAAVNASTAPLVLWMNGGPGCSSLDGLMYEHGPLLVNNDGVSLRVNPYSWNQNANMLYLEAPAGVGFSYSDDPKDYNNNDWQNAQDNLAALQAFLVKFPEFNNRHFYVSGESYGGVYVPTVSVTVAEAIEAGKLNLDMQGFIIGNGLHNYNVLTNTLVEFAYFHGLYGTDLWNQLNAACPNGNFSSTSQPCATLSAQAQNVVYGEGLNWYNLYGSCYHQEQMERMVRLVHKIAPSVQHVNTNGFNVPCINSTGANSYLNLPATKQALHVDLPEINPWFICSGVLNYTSQVTNTLPLWQQLLKRGYRALIYHGDVDMSCNFLQGETQVQSLGMKPLQEFGFWHYNDQVAGGIAVYDNLWFVTVRGAGHMVPQWRPEQASVMINSFLQGTPMQ